MDEQRILDEQVSYYQARAPEYEEWFLRQGRYDRGPEHRAQWIAELAEVEAALCAEFPLGNLLELACGTGHWTQRMAENATRITAVDSSPEAIVLNLARVRSEHVEYIVANLFEWAPDTLYDTVVIAFWLSHVPASRFDSFWRMVRGALAPGGKVFFADGLLDPESTARDHAPPSDSGTVSRKLNDGREFEIVKIFYDSGELLARLESQGWRGYIRTTGKFFFYGCVAPR